MSCKRRFVPMISLFFIFLVTLCLAGCGGASTPATSSSANQYQPVTLQNCGQTLTFTQAPTRVISTGQTTTDILLKLGLGDRIIGTYYKQLYQPEPQFTAAYSRIRDLGGNMITSVPSKEVVLGARPDFVFSAYLSGDFLASYGMATQEQLKAQGVKIYGLSAECSIDATRARINDLYTDIMNIGKIFHVEARAQQVVTDMQVHINQIEQRVKNRAPVPVVAIPMTANPGASGSVVVIGGGMYTDVLRIAGAKNVFGDQTKVYPPVSKEAIANDKPEAYVLIHYVGIPSEKISSYLYKTFPDAPASQKQRVVIVEANHWNAGIFLPDAIEQIAKALHPETFA